MLPLDYLETVFEYMNRDFFTHINTQNRFKYIQISNTTFIKK